MDRNTNTDSNTSKKRIELKVGESVEIFNAKNPRGISIRSNDDGLSLQADSFNLGDKSYQNQVITF